MKKIVKWILIGLIVIACAVGSVYYATLPVAVNGISVEPKTAELFFTENGVADVGRTVTVYSTVSGKIKDTPVTEKQKVKAGDTICVIDTTDLVYQIAQAESVLKSYEAQIANLDIEEVRNKDNLKANRNSLIGELRALEAQENSNSSTTEEQLKQKEEQLRLQNLVIVQNERDLERAKDDMAKAAVLFEVGALAESNYIQATKAVEALESQLSQNRQQLQIIESGDIQSSKDYYEGTKESLKAQVAGIEAALNKSYSGAMKEYYGTLIEGSRNTIDQLNYRIAESTVTASEDGIINVLNIKDTNMVNAQMPVAEIVSDTAYNIEVYVTTNDIDDVYIGQQVDLILKRRGGDKAYIGEVKAIDDKAEVRLSVLGVEERRIKVTVAPITGADEIKEGFDVDVRFTVYREDNILAVPKSAFFVVDDKDMLWVVKDGKAVMNEVTKGVEMRTEFVVDSGLSSGDIVITDADTAGVKNGVNVKVQ